MVIGLVVYELNLGWRCHWTGGSMSFILGGDFIGLVVDVIGLVVYDRNLGRRVKILIRNWGWSPGGLRGQERVVQFMVSSRTRFFTDSMRMFEEFTSVRLCAHFHTVGKLLDPSNVIHVNQFIIRFDKVVHIQ